MPGYRVATLVMVFALSRAGAELADSGSVNDAIAHYEDALRIELEQPELLNNLAWLYATDPGERNPDEAIRMAERAVALGGGQNPSLLDTLAVAYASAGRFTRRFVIDFARPQWSTRAFRLTAQ